MPRRYVNILVNNKLLDIIKTQNDKLHYQLPSLSNKNKIFCYQAFETLLHQFPETMHDYLMKNNRAGGFQSKLFQEYIKILESAIPFTYFINKKPYIISSLLDEKLGVFHGISVFENIINENLFIKNKTHEFYIGGRAGSISKPFYLGKILNIIHKNNKINLYNNIDNYSFHQIKMKEVAVGTPVIVTHLSIPPHYQLGGMVYLNFVRKQIMGAL